MSYAKGSSTKSFNSPFQTALLIRGKIQQLLHRKENWTIAPLCMFCFLG